MTTPDHFVSYRHAPVDDPAIPSSAKPVLFGPTKRMKPHGGRSTPDPDPCIGCAMTLVERVKQTGGFQTTGYR